MEGTANLSFSATTITCQFLIDELWLELLYGIIPIIYLTNVLQCIIFMFWIYMYKRKRLSHECRPDKRERERERGGGDPFLMADDFMNVREGINSSHFQLGLSKTYTHVQSYEVDNAMVKSSSFLMTTSTTKYNRWTWSECFIWFNANYHDTNCYSLY